MQSSTTAHAAHDLVQNEERAMLVADVPHCFQISRNGRHASKSGTHNWFCYEADDGLWAKLLEFCFKLGGFPCDERGVRLSFGPLPIGIAGRNMVHVAHQERLIWCAAHWMS